MVGGVVAEFCLLLKFRCDVSGLDWMVAKDFEGVLACLVRIGWPSILGVVFDVGLVLGCVEL